MKTMDLPYFERVENDSNLLGPETMNTQQTNLSESIDHEA